MAGNPKVVEHTARLLTWNYRCSPEDVKDAMDLAPLVVRMTRRSLQKLGAWLYQGASFPEDAFEEAMTRIRAEEGP